MPTKCCVNKCESTSKCPEIRLFRFPGSGVNLSVLTLRRLQKWKEALGFGPNFNPTHKRICNLHFEKGKPARITDELDSDWVPKLRLPNTIESSTSGSKTPGSSPSSSLLTASSVNDGTPLQSSSDNKRIITTVSPPSRHRSKRFRIQRTPRSSTDLGSTRTKRYSSDSSNSPSIRAASSTSSNRTYSQPEEQSSSCSSNSKSKLSSSSAGRLSRKHQRMLSSRSEAYTSDSSISSNRSNGGSSRAGRFSGKRRRIRCNVRASYGSLSAHLSTEESSKRSCFRSQAAASRTGESSINSESLFSDTSNSVADLSDSSVAPVEETAFTHQSQQSAVINEETEMKLLKEKLREYQHKLNLHDRGFEYISVSEVKCLYYTGITNFATVKRLYEHLEPNISRPRCNFTKQQVFTMTLTKLRLNPQFKTLAYDYNVCLNTIAKYFYRTLNVIDSCLHHSLNVPSLDVLLRHTPESFRQEFGEKRVFIIDCFEVKCETPQNLTAAAAHFSNYKKSETTKFLIAICPDGNICFISPGFGGRCSDKKIVADSGFLDILEPGDVVLADKGFDISNLIESRGAVLNIPSFLKNKKQFEPAEIERNKQVTKYRIHVERCIGILKSKFLILSQTITVDNLVRFENSKNAVDLIARVCCILYNFNPSIIPSY